jgi:hypothetical protein
MTDQARDAPLYSPAASNKVEESMGCALVGLTIYGIVTLTLGAMFLVFLYGIVVLVLGMHFGIELSFGRFSESLVPLSGANMTDLSASMRVKRGLHRFGIVLAIVLGTCTLAIEVPISLERVNYQSARFVALRCADEKLEAKAAATRASPPRISDAAEYELIELGSLFIDPEGNVRQKVGSMVPIEELECGSSIPASREEIEASRTSNFGYKRELVSAIAMAALMTLLVGLAAYFSIAAFSWIIRGFMRG